MRSILSAAAAAIAVVLSASASMADVDADGNAIDSDGSMVSAATTTWFDLGIDVTGVARSALAAKTYLGSLAPISSDVILTTCEHYMDDPQSVLNQDTLAFCALAVGGPSVGSTATFASANLLFVPSTPSPTGTSPADHIKYVDLTPALPDPAGSEPDISE